MDTPDYQPIKQPKVSTLIVEQIKSHILQGNLSPGDPLPSERELMKLFNVSRASLREALNILHGMGFVIISQRKRTRVKSLVPDSFVEPIHALLKEDRETLFDVIEVRKCMESWNAYYAAERASDAEIERLKHIIDSMMSQGPKKQRLIDNDARFHVSISDMTHNKIQSHLMFSIYGVIQNSVIISYEDSQTQEILEEHLNIYQAIKKRDPKLARLEMKHHLDRVQARIHLFFGGKGATS
ncbi:FadR/GntR family transcriptional regulator [Desulfoluna sp.]|uniref:FadR/GntR family transcriptional regulator n=1 Tax=Desulfoluna sp. TaxID=2045199 RepID=UPI002620E884|nr:FadR/GntR family transcriptional regulator [Desulfoluna sp.]